MRILTLAVGFAAGYVMGSKAGRQRYEQIRQTASDFLHTPVVSDAQARVKELAERGVDTVAAKVGLSSSAHQDTPETVTVPATPVPAPPRAKQVS